MIPPQVITRKVPERQPDPLDPRLRPDSEEAGSTPNADSTSIGDSSAEALHALIEKFENLEETRVTSIHSSPPYSRPIFLPDSILDLFTMVFAHLFAFRPFRNQVLLRRGVEVIIEAFWFSREIGQG